MARPVADLVVAEKCHRCKLKQTGKCLGQLLMKGAVLVACSEYIHYNSNKVISNKVIAQYPNKKE